MLIFAKFTFSHQIRTLQHVANQLEIKSGLFYIQWSNQNYSIRTPIFFQWVAQSEHFILWGDQNRKSCSPILGTRNNWFISKSAGVRPAECQHVKRANKMSRLLDLICGSLNVFLCHCENQKSFNASKAGHHEAENKTWYGFRMQQCTGEL